MADPQTEATRATICGFTTRSTATTSAIMALMSGDCVFENTRRPTARLAGQAAVRRRKVAVSLARSHFAVETVCVRDRGALRWLYTWGRPTRRPATCAASISFACATARWPAVVCEGLTPSIAVGSRQVSRQYDGWHHNGSSSCIVANGFAHSYNGAQL
jgi:hypothetical protein